MVRLVLLGGGGCLGCLEEANAQRASPDACGGGGALGPGLCCDAGDTMESSLFVSSCCCCCCPSSLTA
jgi:hypothetical protein